MMEDECRIENRQWAFSQVQMAHVGDPRPMSDLLAEAESLYEWLVKDIEQVSA